MATWTYAALTSAIVNTAELNGDTDFQTELPNIIDRAEWRLTRDLDSYGLVSNFTTSISSGNPWLPLPANSLIIKSLNIRSDSYRTNLILKTNEWLLEYWSDRTSTGTPKYYARYDNANAIMAPAPASVFVAEIQIVVRPSAISAGETTNYFTQFCPNALFAGCMVETAFFMKNGQMAQLWEGRYEQEVALLRNETRRARRDDMRPNNKDAWSEDNLQEDAS